MSRCVRRGCDHAQSERGKPMDGSGEPEMNRFRASSDFNRCVVVTGAGSGIGRAVAWSLANHGWQVALVGRRAEALKDTVLLAGAGTTIELFPCDIADATAVDAMASSVTEQFGRVDALVNAAGVNTPLRSLETLTRVDFHRVMETNLHGAYYCTQA